MKTLLIIFATAMLCYQSNAQNSDVDADTQSVVTTDTTGNQDSLQKKKSIGMNVKPVRIDFHLQKGEGAIQPIYITNKFPTKVQFKARFSDWMRDSMGGHQYYPPGTLSRSIAPYASFNNDVVEIEPGETKEILIRIAIPDTAESMVSEMKWCLVFVESVRENRVLAPTDSSRTSVNTIFRAGIHILQTPPQMEAEKNLEMLSFSSLPDVENTYQILCENTGETQLDCKGYLEISSLATGEKVQTEPIRFPMFPGQRRYTNYELPEGLAKGKYTVLAVVDANEDDVPIQASEATIEIK